MRPAILEKKSLCDSESLPVVQQKTHIRPISWSKPIGDSEGFRPLIGRGPDIPVCVYAWKCVCCCSQTEREVSSRNARIVASLSNTLKTERIQGFERIGSVAHSCLFMLYH